MPGSQDNPYEAPQAVVRDSGRDRGRDRQRLAGRGTRLGAFLLEGLFGGVIVAPMIIGFVMDQKMREATTMIAFGVTGVLGLAYFVYTLILLSQNGWTLGKKVCGIRIVRTDGSDASLGRIFWLRMVVNGLIGNIPIAGPMYALADPLFIFNEDRRCVHDMIADTKVIEA